MEQQPILSAVHQEEDKDDDFGSINREQSSSALTFETVRVRRSWTLYTVGPALLLATLRS